MPLIFVDPLTFSHPSQSNTYFMSAPAAGPMEGDLAQIQQFV
jgi:hypothetical protein